MRIKDIKNPHVHRKPCNQSNNYDHFSDMEMVSRLYQRVKRRIMKTIQIGISGKISSSLEFLNYT